MENWPPRWILVTAASLIGAFLLTFYGTTQSPEELLLFQDAVRQLINCAGTACPSNDTPSGRDWHHHIGTVPLNVDKLEPGIVTWTQEAADAIVEEIERVQFPADCKATRWLAIRQLSDDILYDYQNFLALLIFGASLGYTVVPIHDSPTEPYATCREKNLHCFFRPFTNCSLYTEPGRLVQYGDAFYDYTHGRDFLHRDMGKVIKGDWGERPLTLIPYGPYYPNERPYREEWLSSLWERLSSVGAATVVGGGQASPEHIEAMVFSVVSDWMFKPVKRIEDQALEILAQQRGVRQPVLGVQMQTRFGGGPERFGVSEQVDVLAYDEKKMKRLLKDLKWAYKTGSDNAGHRWNSTFVITDSDFFLEELVQKPDALGVASKTDVHFDKLEAAGPGRRLLGARRISSGFVGRRRRRGDVDRRDAPDRSWGHELGLVSGNMHVGKAMEMGEKSGGHKKLPRQSAPPAGYSQNGSLIVRKGAEGPRLSSLSHIAGFRGARQAFAPLYGILDSCLRRYLWWTIGSRAAWTRDAPGSSSHNAEGSPPNPAHDVMLRRKLRQVDESSNKSFSTLKEPLEGNPEVVRPEADVKEEPEEGDLIGRPESGQDWSAAEARRKSEDRALANALILARLSDYAIVSSRSNVGRLAAQVIGARKRVTQTGPLGPVVHSTSGGEIVNPLGASAGPGLPGGTLRWSNTVEKLVYEELDRTQFPEQCGEARWLVAKLNNQGLALNFHAYQMALVLAMSLGRTLVIEPSEADPSESGACTIETLPTLFKPLTGCEYSNASSGTEDDVTVSWDDVMTSSVVGKRVVRLESVVPTPSGFVDRGQAWVEPSWWAGFLNNLIVAGNLRLEGGGDVHRASFLDLHFMLWSITTQWMWRPQPHILDMAEAIKCAWPDRRAATLAVHVRRTDRGWGDGYFRDHHEYRPLVDYGHAIEALEAEWGLRWPSVFLFTDTASVLRQAAANVSGLGFTDPGRQVMYNPLVELDPIRVHQTHLNVPCRQRNHILQHLVAEITVAAEMADYAVFAGSASGARIVWELMGAHRQFAQTKAQGDLVHSLDTGWYYEW